MRFADVVVAVGARAGAEVVPARAQMATTLGFHIILACLGIALPSVVLLAEFIGLRRRDETALRLARRWSQAMGVLIAVGAVTGTVLSFEMGLLWPGLMRQYGAVLGVPFGVEGLFFFLEAIFAGLTISNGIGWSPDASTMYLNDSGTGCLYVFRFDGPSGAISDRRTLVHIDQPGVVPDGLTVDEEGGIWVALWNGAAVHRYAPDGTLLASVPLPVQRPTSCAFGGLDRDTLFVTSARTDLDDKALTRQPHAGKVFAIDGLGIRGLPCMPYRGRTPRFSDR